MLDILRTSLSDARDIPFKHKVDESDMDLLGSGCRRVSQHNEARGY